MSYLGSEEKVRVVIALPGEDAQETTIENTYEALRAFVGGPITAIATGEIVPGTVAYVHDEGLLLSLPWNRALGSRYLAGPLIAYGSNAEGEEISLTDGQAALLVEWFNQNTARLVPTPSSVEELERRSGQAARGFISIDEKGRAVRSERYWSDGHVETREYREGCVKCEHEGLDHEGPHVAQEEV